MRFQSLARFTLAWSTIDTKSGFNGGGGLRTKFLKKGIKVKLTKYLENNCKIKGKGSGRIQVL